MSEIKITNENFETEVINSSVPVLLDFWAEWCGPCRMLAPILEEIAKEYDGKVKICKANVDDQSELASRFGISSIPTVLAFNNGKTVGTSVGYRPKEALLGLLSF